MDRQDAIGCNQAADEQSCPASGVGDNTADHPQELDVYVVFKRYVHDACMGIELAAQCDTLECPDWHRLRRQLSHIAGIAGLFDKPDLGQLARELEKGLDILSPRARVRRLMNARDEFARLANLDGDRPD